MNLAKALSDLNPRICDCDYCQDHPSAIVSDPEMIISLVGGSTKICKNGDQLANFYYCTECNNLLAVGSNLNGVMKGAVNYALFEDAELFGEKIQIKPRLLQASEKLERWSRLWGTLNGV